MWSYLLQLTSQLLGTGHYNYNHDTGVCCLDLQGSADVAGASGANPDPASQFTSYIQVAEEKDTEYLSFKGKSLALIPQAPWGRTGS